MGCDIVLCEKKPYVEKHILLKAGLVEMILLIIVLQIHDVPLLYIQLMFYTVLPWLHIMLSCKLFIDSCS